MPVYRLAETCIEALPDTDFAACGIKERGDLQRLLRANVGVVAPDVLVIAEEFGEWEESKRRIDLLGVDTSGNLVVIELKRDDDGHMELQAIRYAAMVAGMTFAKAVEVYQGQLDRTANKGDARKLLLDHLKRDDVREEDFAQDCSIILVSSSFSKELTTTVLWLNDRDMDIRCVRMKPYKHEGKVIVDVQQIVPLPEAEEYTIQIKQKSQATRADKVDRFLLRKAFWQELLPQCGRLTPRFVQLKPNDDCWIGAGAGTSGMRFVYIAWQDESCVELYIDRGSDSEEENKAILKYLDQHRAKIETVFGGPLEWDYLEGKRAARLRSPPMDGGVRSPRNEWPAIQARMMDAMARLEKAVGPHLASAVG